jgi:hypothetical protein
VAAAQVVLLAIQLGPPESRRQADASSSGAPRSRLSRVS